MKLNKISKAFFINLERRKDRLDHINKNLPFYAERFEAIDANKLELNEEIKKIFSKCLNKLTKAEIACCLSHYNLWKRLTLDKSSDNYLILEDDAVFKEGFTNFWNQVFSKHIPKNYNLIYLGGCQPWNKPHYHKVLQKHNDYFFNIKRNNFFSKDDHFWHMNASSYILSKQAASTLCQWVEQQGINQALDNFMQNFFNKNKLFAAPKSIYHLNPLMSYQLHEENDNIEIDKNSDLRYAKERFDKKIINIDPASINEDLIDRKINLHYWPGMAGKKNFGDEMSSYIMKKLLPFDQFSYNINPRECEVNMIALGSYIQMAKDDYYIFGSGVRTERDRAGYKKLNVISVRGPKSRDFLISKGVDCPELYGDPGLFISRYYRPTIDYSLRGKIGIVPHITDKTNYNKNNSDKFYIIDPCQHWTKVIDQICSCKSIVSSSLHGLICADSYNIPNVWMEYKLLDEGDFKFIDYFLSQGREINKISSLEYINDDTFYRGGNNINLNKLSAALYSSGLSEKNNNIYLINPTAISHDNKQYTLYRGEKYLKNQPPPLGFNRSELSYWIECDGVKKQCIFDFGDYSYKAIKRIDLEKHKNRSTVEDLRFIQSSIKNTEEGLICLATCSFLPYTRIYAGTKKANGDYDKTKGVGLEFTFRMGYCEVNLTKGIIKYKSMIDENSQVQNEKNWTSFVYNKKLFVIYSMFPLRYATANSIDEISFKGQNISGRILMSCSTNPINVGGNKFAMLCHRRDKDKHFHYDYKLVSFKVVDSKIVDINQYNVNIDSGLYCSSILMEGDKIKVFAGKEDIDNLSFYIDAPWLNKKRLEKVSVIIPTIWKANNYLRRSLQDLDKEYLVEEIIVINNNKEETPNWIKENKKVKLIDPGERLYFNKSVNLGVDLCKNDICCVLNDDVIIVNRNIFKYISEQLKHESGAIFISKNSINAYGVNLSIELKKISRIEHGNGMLFFLRKSSFVKIPEKIVHHHGDGFIAAINKLQKKQNYTIQGFKIRTIQSASQKYAKEVISKDWRIYKEVFDNLNQFLPQKISFPALQKISSKQIPNYDSYEVKHWNTGTEAHFQNIRNKETLNIIWQINPDSVSECYETDWIRELFNDIKTNEIIDCNYNVLKDNSLIIYNDIYDKKEKNKHTENLYKYLEKARHKKNVSIMHLGDEFIRARTDHYKNFKAVIRTTFNKNLSHLNNLIQIPLGYKQGFHD